MNLLSGISDFFGLDIGTTAIRLVQLHGNGRLKTLVKYAYVPIDSKLSLSDAKVDQQKLTAVIRDLVAQAKVTTNNVAVNLPSSRVFTTVVDMERLSKDELGKTIRYQADSLIPTPVAESKIDWAVLGDSPADKNKVEVLLSSVPNKFIEERLDILEASGLNVIAFEPDNIVLARALVATDATTPQMVIDIGHKGTDMVISMNGAPHLTRLLPSSTEALVHAAVQNLNIDEKQADQFVFKFGLDQSKLEGQVYRAIVGTVELLTTEIEKSIKFFETRYNNVKLERIIVTGGASVLPEFPLYLANKFGINVEIGNAWRNVSFAPDRQNELLAISNQFSIAAGLAERQT
ncbi:MAG TPA: type IV pilus assembly protein PilM [Candidatus Binatia bacterium]|nr:type IV pilus assembly protein PilM [Candidatus Binatia bacterium]